MRQLRATRSGPRSTRAPAAARRIAGVRWSARRAANTRRRGRRHAGASIRARFPSWPAAHRAGARPRTRVVAGGALAGCARARGTLLGWMPRPTPTPHTAPTGPGPRAGRSARSGARRRRLRAQRERRQPGQVRRGRVHRGLARPSRVRDVRGKSHVYFALTPRARISSGNTPRGAGVAYAGSNRRSS